MALEGRSSHGEWEPCARRVDFRGGVHDPKVCQASLVREEKLEGWEAGLDGQDIRRTRHEAISCPSVDLVPEHRELPNHVDGGYEDIRAIAEDGEEEGGGQSMAEEGGEADTWGRETLDCHEGRLHLGQPLDKIGGSGD